MKPLISVIIPAYNSAETIGIAISSILEQTYSNLEIIVVDDNSEDNTKEIVEQLRKKDNRIKYYILPQDDPYRINSKGVNINAGYIARNFGADNARGEIVVFQDADDASLNDRIKIQYEVMKKYNACHAVVDWQKFKDEYVGKSLNLSVAEKDLIMPDEILKSVKENSPIPKWMRDPYSKRASKNIFVTLAKKSGRFFLWKKIIPYPCSGNSAMVKKEVFKEIRFRSLWERTRPSRKGRGADMDFNYAVAERFKDSIAIKLPLYLWRYPKKENNPKYSDIKFILR